MVMEYFNGRMGENIKDGGIKENNMG